MAIELEQLKNENADLKKQLAEIRSKEHGRYKYSQGCRCEICKAAKRDSQKKYKQKLTAEKSAEQKG